MGIMGERIKRIMTGFGIIVFAMVGLWEYMQLFMYFDIPQTIIIMPIVGTLTVLLIRKIWFVVPIATVIVCLVYQMVERNANFMGAVEVSESVIFLNLLPFLVIFMFVGIGAGFLIRVLINKKKPKVIGIICCIIGVFLTFAPGILFFGNPFYPVAAKRAITNYGKTFETKYKVSEVQVFYDMENQEYQGRVVMSDGVIYPLYYDRSTGTVSEK